MSSVAAVTRAQKDKNLPAEKQHDKQRQAILDYDDFLSTKFQRLEAYLDRMVELDPDQWQDRHKFVPPYNFVALGDARSAQLYLNDPEETDRHYSLRRMYSGVPQVFEDTEGWSKDSVHCVKFKTTREMANEISVLFDEEENSPGSVAENRFPLSMQLRKEPRIFASNCQGDLVIRAWEKNEKHIKPYRTKINALWTKFQEKAGRNYNVGDIFYFPNGVLQENNTLHPLRARAFHGIWELASLIISREREQKYVNRVDISVHKPAQYGKETPAVDKAIFEHIKPEGTSYYGFKASLDVQMFDNLSSGTRHSSVVISIKPIIPVRDILANMASRDFPLAILCRTINMEEKDYEDGPDPNSLRVQRMASFYDRIPFTGPDDPVFGDLSLYVRKG
jgi:hypothetical protein